MHARKSHDFASNDFLQSVIIMFMSICRSHHPPLCAQVGVQTSSLANRTTLRAAFGHGSSIAYKNHPILRLCFLEPHFYFKPPNSACPVSCLSCCCERTEELRVQISERNSGITDVSCFSSEAEVEFLEQTLTHCPKCTKTGLISLAPLFPAWSSSSTRQGTEACEAFLFSRSWAVAPWIAFLQSWVVQT